MYNMNIIVLPVNYVFVKVNIIVGVKNKNIFADDIKKKLYKFFLKIKEALRYRALVGNHIPYIITFTSLSMESKMRKCERKAKKEVSVMVIYNIYYST